MNNIEWNIYKENFFNAAQKEGKSSEYINNNLEYAQKLFEQNLPVVFDGTHLGMLTGIKYEYLYQVSNNSRHFYRIFFIKKRNGSKRKIEEPLPNLKIVQKWILESILNNIIISPYAKAYKPKTSIKDNVRFHRNQKLVLKLDIKDFFSSIDKKSVNTIFKNFGYNEKVSNLMSELCTINNRLPQGASTSAYLSNIYLLDFDRVISHYCVKKKIRYTRYADDLTFSGDFNYKELIGVVELRLKIINLELNYEKTRILKRNQKQIVTGIVVNDKIQVDKKIRKNLRLEMYYIKKFGLNSHLAHIDSIMSSKEYLKSLKGKLEFCLFINPKDDELNEYLKYIKQLLQDN